MLSQRSCSGFIWPMLESFVFRPPAASYRKDIRVWCFKRLLLVVWGLWRTVNKHMNMKKNKVSEQELFY